MSSFYQENSINRSNSILPPKQAFSFPILKTDEITKCLNELGIPVTHDELVNPEKYKDSCRRMLEILSEICTGVSRDELNQPAFAGLQALSYPELHEESIPQINSFRSCGKMMEICEVQDFTIKDFIFPTPNKLRKHLSGIINFAKFREERLVLLSDLSTTREELLDHLNELRDRNETLNNRLSLLREQTADESNMITSLEIECKEMEETIMNLTNLQEEIRDETNNLKTLNNDLKENITLTTTQLEETTNLHKKLSSQIVSSPEKFRKQIIEVGQTLQNEQKDTKLADRKIRDLSAWIVNIEESQNEINNALEAIQEVRSEVERQKSVIIELDTQKQSIVANRVALSELDQNVHQLNRHAGRAEEKLLHLRKQAAARGGDTQQSIEGLHKQLVEAEAYRLQLKSRAERVEGDVIRLEKESAAEMISADQEIADIVASYSRLEKIVTSHLKGLQKVMELKVSDKPSLNVA